MLGAGVPHPGDVGDDIEGDPTARDRAAVRHPLQQALGEALHPPTETTPPSQPPRECVYVCVRVCVCMSSYLPPGEADADAFAQHQLQGRRVAEQNHDSHGQEHALVRCPRPTQLGTAVDRRVPGRLRLHLDERGEDRGLASWLLQAYARGTPGREKRVTSESWCLTI